MLIIIRTINGLKCLPEMPPSLDQRPGGTLNRRGATMLIFNVSMMKTPDKKTLLMYRKTLAAALCMTGALALTSHAQQSDSVLVDVDACIELESREDQLACYEERVNEALRMRESEAESAGVAAAAESDATLEPEDSRTSRRAARREARLAEQRQADLERRQRAAEEAAIAAAEAAAALADPNYTAGEIVAEVTALREIEPDGYLITLDNGQIWRQSQTKRYPLFVGATVKLRPSPWGPSYRLTDPNVGNFIQVRRID